MKTITIILGLLLLLVMGCSKGNTLTGTTVADIQTESNDIDTAAAENTGPTDASADKTETGETKQAEESAGAESAGIKTYEQKGTCTEDSMGIVRVFDKEGKKFLYRNECLGGLLVDYGCENNELDTQTSRCKNGCEIVNHFGQCK